MSGINLNAIQWAAWFSPDPEEREAFRREVREHLRAAIPANGYSDHAVVGDRGAIIERVYRDGRIETLIDTPRVENAR